MNSDSYKRRPSLGMMVLGLTLSLCAAACSSSSDEGPVDRSGTTPLYLAATRVWDDTSTTSYFHVLPSIDADTVVDGSQALEVGGSAKLFANGPNEWFAIGSGESPTITRYTLNERGQLERGKAMSLQTYGVQDLWDTLYFASAEKAYYPDPSSGQLVVWNPSTMTITGTVDLSETVREGYLSHHGLRSIRRGTDILFTMSWFDWETNDAVVGETALIALDTETDSIRKVDVDRRCGGITQVVEHPSGDAYFVSSALAAAAHELGRLSTAPCALRVRAGEDSFDADYQIRLSDVAGSGVAGEPMPGDGGKILLRVADRDQLEVTAESRSWDLTGQAAWRWVSWDVEANEAENLDELAPSTADVFWFDVDGKLFASESTNDYAETTLIEVTGGGAPRRALTAPGLLHGIARIR